MCIDRTVTVPVPPVTVTVPGTASLLYLEIKGETTATVQTLRSVWGTEATELKNRFTLRSNSYDD